MGEVMGRELRRKENKKKGKNVKEVIQVEDRSQKEVYKMIKILIIVLIVLVLIYLLVSIFITKEITFGNRNNNEGGSFVNVNSSNILASEIFRQKEEKYYVYFYDFKSDIADIESAIVTKLTNQKVYRVDTSSGFNSKYVSEVGNSNVQKVEDLKVVVPTLMLIENDIVIGYVDGEEAIVNYIDGN